MSLEQTLSIVKPDAVKANVIGGIVDKLERGGLRIVAQKMIRLTETQAQFFYAEHKDRPFFSDLIKFMIEGPVVVQILEGDSAISTNRDIMGATNSKEAASGTIRHAFGTDIERNAVHGSDSQQAAEREIAFFFSQAERVALS